MIVLIGCSGLVGLMTLSVPSVEGKSIGSLKREAFMVIAIESIDLARTMEKIRKGLTGEKKSALQRMKPQCSL